tara:strand:- start:24633 stop:24887 length:255 start_codon:yes stop_codon:yes gene_type:complete
MHASELLQALENSAIEVLDNQAVMDTMTGGVETSAAFGAMDGHVIDDLFVNAMPQPSEEAVNTAKINTPLPDFGSPSDDAPGLG